MSLELIQYAVPNSDGTILLWKDITGNTSPTAYGKNGNINYGSVTAVRIKTALYSNLVNTTTINSGTFTQYTEYRLVSPSSAVVDGKTLGVGSLFIPQTAAISVPSGSSWETTGYYCYPVLSTWLPTATEVALSLANTEIGLDSGSVIPDELLQAVYEIYYDTQFGTTAAVNGQQYMVLSGTAVYGGNTYKAGEIFTGANTNNITTTGTFAKMYATSFGYHIMAYGYYTRLYQLIISYQGIYQNEIQDELYQIKSILDTLTFVSSTGNVSYTKFNDLMQLVGEKLTYLENNVA